MTILEVKLGKLTKTLFSKHFFLFFGTILSYFGLIYLSVDTYFLVKERYSLKVYEDAWSDFV